jgi:organizing structure protein 2
LASLCFLTIAGEVKSVIPKDETLTPGLIYVLVAGLTGTVLTRTRSFPVRFLAPPLFTLAALPYFLPQTAHNLRRYVSDLEDKHAPELAASHDRFNQALELHWHMGLDKLRGASDEARVWSSQAVHSVEEATGLKVAEAVRLGQDRVQVAKAKVAEAAERTTEKIKTPPPPVVEQVIEVQPIAVIVAPVEPAFEAQAVVVPVVAAEPVEVIVAATPVAPADALAAAPAKAAGDKPEKPRDLVAKPVADSGKRLV